MYIVGNVIRKTEASFNPRLAGCEPACHLANGAVEMVEPMEETRNEVLFATEPVLASLALAIPDSGRSSSSVELDEIEVCIRHERYKTGS